MGLWQRAHLWVAAEFCYVYVYSRHSILAIDFFETKMLALYLGVRLSIPGFEDLRCVKEAGILSTNVRWIK